MAGVVDTAWAGAEGEGGIIAITAKKALLFLIPLTIAMAARASIKSSRDIEYMIMGLLKLE